MSDPEVEKSRFQLRERLNVKIPMAALLRRLSLLFFRAQKALIALTCVIGLERQFTPEVPLRSK
eukprot:5335861-Amphidinium_carterae.1